MGTPSTWRPHGSKNFTEMKRQRFLLPVVVSRFFFKSPDVMRLHNLCIQKGALHLNSEVLEKNLNSPVSVKSLPVPDAARMTSLSGLRL